MPGLSKIEMSAFMVGWGQVHNGNPKQYPHRERISNHKPEWRCDERAIWSRTRSRQRYKRCFSATAKSIPNKVSLRWACTTGGARETRCQDRAGGSPTISCNTFSQGTSSTRPGEACIPKLLHCKPSSATTRTPASRCRTNESGAARDRSVSDGLPTMLKLRRSLPSFLRWMPRKSMSTAACQKSGGKGNALGLHSALFFGTPRWKHAG